jgi:hypothetical protein
MASLFVGVKKAIRKALIAKIGSIVVDGWPEYQAQVNKVIQYHYAVWEHAVGEAAKAYELRETDETAWREMHAAAMDARAAFVDAVREYLQIDLSRNDHGLPIRLAAYEWKDVEITTRHVGADLPVKTVQKVLSKQGSSEMPELNYPTPWWRGDKLDRIEKYLQSIVKLANEAEAKKALLTPEQLEQLARDAGLAT